MSLLLPQKHATPAVCYIILQYITLRFITLHYTTLCDTQKHATPGSARTHATVLYCTPTFDAIWWYENMLLNTVQVFG